MFLSVHRDGPNSSSEHRVKRTKLNVSTKTLMELIVPFVPLALAEAQSGFPDEEPGGA